RVRQSGSSLTLKTTRVIGVNPETRGGPMIRRNKAKLFVVIFSLIGLAFSVLPGQAQKPKTGKDAPSPRLHRLGRLVPIVGHAVGFAETAPLRELAARNPQFDAALVGEGEEIN